MQGTTNEIATAANGVKESLPFLLSLMDHLGGPMAYNHYPVGWAHARIRRCNGRSRSRRISAGRATAW